MRPSLRKLARSLRHSRVLRAVGISAAAAFGVSQGVAELFPVLGISDAVTRTVVVASIAAVPVVAVVTWLFGRMTELDEAPEDDASETTSASGAPIEPVAPTDGTPSLAVLPFDDLTTGEDDRYFADGVTEEILNAVARLDGLRVAARTSSFAFRDRTGDVREIARELGVDAVLEGSVRRAGERLRVAVQLVAAADGSRLFGETYERRLEDVFDVQDEIARAVAHALRVELVEEERGSGRTTRDLDAYRSYLKGSQLLAERTPGALESALEAFDEALSRDPSYALAHAGRGEALALLGDLGVRPVAAALDEAEGAASRSIELSADLPEGHAVLGLARTLAWRWDGVEECFARAVALGPDFAEAHHWRSIHLTAVGRMDEAMEALARAQRLDPLSAKVHSALGSLHYYAREPETARAELERSLELDPESLYAAVMLALVLELEGRFDDALDQLDSLPSSPGLGPPFVAAARARVEAARGIRPAAAQGRAELERLATRGDAAHFCLAAVEVALGDADGAFAALAGAVEAHDGWMLSLQVHPWMDPLRDDPRYADVLGSLGLAAASHAPAAAAS